ncbi:MAG: non-heme iron oxygenase ferredoxin subunit [Acidimicrobiia bacterium]
MSWVKVIPLNDLEESQGMLVEMNGERIALFRIGNEVFAIADTCSHAEASLSEGEVFDEAVECPRHGSEFDLRTGEPNSLPATRPVAVFPSKVEEGDVYLMVGEES